MEAPLICAYPREASIAEKFHAMVTLDIRNSRMKDFYDIWFMANTWTFDMVSLRKAIVASFETPINDSRRSPVCPNGRLPKRFAEEAAMERIREPTEPSGYSPSLEEVGTILRTFLLPCISGDVLAGAKVRSWTPSQHWRTA
jgi:hypothetical protein